VVREGAAALIIASPEMPEALVRQVARPDGIIETGLQLADVEDGPRTRVLLTLEASPRRGGDGAGGARRYVN